MKFFLLTLSILLCSVFGENLLREITKTKDLKIYYFNTWNGLIIKYRDIDEKSLHLASRSILTFEVCSDNKINVDSFDDVFKIYHSNPHFNFKLCKKSIGNIEHCQKLHNKKDIAEIRPILDIHEKINKYDALEVCLKRQGKSEIQHLFSILNKRVVTISHFLKKYADNTKNKQMSCTEFPLKEIGYSTITEPYLIGTRTQRRTRTIVNNNINNDKIKGNATKVTKGKKTAKARILNKGVINYFIFNKNTNPNRKFIRNIVENIIKKEMDLKKIKNMVKKEVKNSRKNETEIN